MHDFTADDVNALADKLDELELSSGERAALYAVLDRAVGDLDDDDVTGFSAEAPYANQEVSYVRPRLAAVLLFDEGDAFRSYVGETEKHVRG